MKKIALFLSILNVVSYGQYYYAVSTSKSSNDAQSYCLSVYGTNLATITSSTYNSYALSACKTVSSSTCHIGLTDVSSEGTYKWRSGVSTSYTNWNSGEPNNANSEDCVEMYTSTGKWNDISCTSYTRPFLCDVSTPTSIPTKAPTKKPTFSPTRRPTTSDTSCSSPLAMDIMIALDSSSSVGTSTAFTAEKNFTIDIINKDISSQSHIGVVQYSTGGLMLYHLDSTQLPRSLITNNVWTAPFTQGLTYTDKAVELSIEQFANYSNNENRLLVLISHGASSSGHSPCSLKSQLDAYDVSVIVVTASSSSGLECLVDDTANDIILIDSFTSDEFAYALGAIYSLTCQTPSPTGAPSKLPTKLPTHVPTKLPSHVPSSVPTKLPSSHPTRVPSHVPTKLPTKLPSQVPTRVPSYHPSAVPTKLPSQVPTRSPSKQPTKVPTKLPSQVPTKIPSQEPTKLPTKLPSQVPTRFPTGVPTKFPTAVPTAVPTCCPSDLMAYFQNENMSFMNNDGNGDHSDKESSLFTYWSILVHVGIVLYIIYKLMNLGGKKLKYSKYYDYQLIPDQSKNSVH